MKSAHLLQSHLMEQKGAAFDSRKEKWDMLTSYLDQPDPNFMPAPFYKKPDSKPKVEEAVRSVYMDTNDLIMMMISPFGQLGLWAPSSGVRDVYIHTSAWVCVRSV
jgi:hypothetical protein